MRTRFTTPPERPPLDPLGENYSQYRLRRMARPLDTTDDATFIAWCATPDTDHRTLDEFAADGGLPPRPKSPLEPAEGWARR